MARYFAAIDEGTTSTRTMIFDEEGHCISEHQIVLETHCPHNGWVELRPEEIWAATQATWFEALNKAKLSPEAIASMGLTNQRETTILWHRKTGRPIYNAIVWQDRRTAEACDLLRTPVLDKMIQEKTGLLLDPYFSATKIAWILKNVPNAYTQALAGELAFGTIDSFLLFRMTNGRSHFTDMTNAARTLLFHIDEKKWDPVLLELFQIPSALLPTVQENIADFGLTEAKVWGAEIPVRVMIGDQQAALVGQSAVLPNTAKCTYGTGGFLMLNTGHERVQSQHRLLQTLAFQVQGQSAYAIEGSIFSVGTTVRWLKDTMHLMRHVADSEVLAASLPDNGGVYLVPAFTGLGAPDWQPNARAAILGLTQDSQAAHIVRAGLEAIAYQTADLLEALYADGFPKITALRVDGGVVKNQWLLQFLSDLLQITVLRSAHSEATVYGVMQLLRLDAGIFHSLVEMAEAWTADKTFLPQKSALEMATYYQQWRKAVSKVL